jgi:NADPH-dependent curcumin reductase
MLGWCEYAVMATNALARVSIPHGMTLSSALGVLGGTGLTAFFGLEKAAPKAGDVVVVSAAAGATGSVVAQLAKRVHSCTVIGIAGGSEKCSYLVDELGLDAAVDRKVSLARRVPFREGEATHVSS